MKKTNKIAALGLALTLMVSALTACGGNKQSSTASGGMGSKTKSSAGSVSQATSGSSNSIKSASTDKVTVVIG